MCWKCGKAIDTSHSIYRSDLCPVCSRPLHSCLNCVFYEKGSHYDCHETVEEPVKDKEDANFCDFFKARSSFDGQAQSEDKAQKARDAFAGLFGN